MRYFLLLVLLLLPTTAAVAQSNSPSREETGVRAALEHYLQGHATGEGTHFRRAFHPEGKVVSIRDGQLVQRTIDEYIAAAAPGRPAADEAQRSRRILSVDISGNAAMAKIELDYPSIRFIDYMSLVKVGDEWKIINKAFYAEPKPRP